MLLNNGSVVPLAPQGLAELAPQLATSWYYPDVGFQLERDFALFGAMYRAQPWIRTVVDKRANAVGRLPLEVWREGGDTRSLDTASGYASLLADPCPGYLDSYTFWQWVSSTIDIYGETYLAITKHKESGKPVALLPMHPSRVAIKRAPNTGLYSYIFSSGAGPTDGLVTFAQQDVVPFRLFNPERLERGLSRLESLKSTIMAEDSSRNALSAAWRNAGRPNVVLETGKILGPDGRKRLKESFDASHAGSSKAGQALVLEDGVTAKPFQMSATEMQFIQTRQLNREEICSVYDIAPTIVHILEHATFSNISAQMRAFYRDTMAPHLEFIESVLDHYVGQYWTGARAARFAVDEVIRGDFEMRADSVSKLESVGVLTPNEGRELMGLTRSDHRLADSLIANSAIQELGEPQERMMIKAEAISDPDNLQLVNPDVPPALPAAAVPPTHVPPVGSLHGMVLPQLTAGPTPKHLREVKGALGRGLDVREFALQLAKKCPDDLEDILRAVAIAIQHRDAA